jgi:uncharacterized protein YigE (DUF2233 family)
MALGLNKILIANTNTNTVGAYPQNVVISSIGIGNTTLMNAGTLTSQYVPAGLYIMPTLTTANVAIELNTGTNNNNWITYIASNSGGTIVSDGYNVRANATVSNQTLTLYTVNGGQNVSATFTS